GRILAAGYADGPVRLWDVAGGRGRARPSPHGHSWAVQCLAFSPDGSILMSGGINDGLKLWDVATGRERAAIGPGDDFIKAAGFAPDGRTLIVARRGGVIQHWDVAAGQETARRQIHLDTNRVALSSDGRLVASGGIDALVRV